MQDTTATLHSATTNIHDQESVIDPTLHDGHNPDFLDPALAQEEIDATTAEIINASIRTAAQAHAAAEAAEAVVAQAVAEAGIDPLEGPPQVQAPVTSSSKTKSLYPFIRPQRDENTECPIEQVFPNKEEFEVWLASESAWCHYVQRRVTNPEKRAEERARARDKLNEKKLAALTPEEIAATPPVKKRQRQRTSQVACKITYTCHHAGKYEPQHNADIPQAKRRMNTKSSVKCGCLSRIVINQMEDGEVKSAFWWKHNGHDPFEEKEIETYRLPQSVTAWLLTQFQKGRKPEDIKAMLDAPDPEKAERIRRATLAALSNPSSSTHPIPQPPADSELDPSLTDMDALTNHVHGSTGTGMEGDLIGEDEDLPPVEAYGLQIKYAALYNRWRKVMPPLKVVKAGELANGIIAPPRASRSRPNKSTEEGEEGVKKTRKRKTQEEGGEGSKPKPKRSKGKGKAVEEVEEIEEEVIDPSLGMEGMGDMGLPEEDGSNDNDNFHFYDMPTDTITRTLASEAVAGDHHEDMLRASAVGDDPSGMGGMGGMDDEDEEEEPDEPIEMVENRVVNVGMMDDDEEEDEPEEMIENRDDSRLMVIPQGGEGMRDSAENEGEGEEIDDPRLTHELHLLASEITSTWRH